MKRSSYLSMGLLLAVVVWLLSGAIASTPEPELVIKETAKPLQAMKVKVQNIIAQEITREIVVQGELEPLRQVEVRAQTSSKVMAIRAIKGESVKQSDLIIELATQDRVFLYKQAQAEVKSQKLQVSAARKLNKQGLQSENRLKAAQAALAAAEATLQRAKLELDYIKIKAPFDSVLEQRYVELGSHLEQGDRVALMVDKSVLKAVGNVSQQSVSKLSLGQVIKVRLLDGREAEGRISYIASLGDAETHSFRVEAEVPNPDGALNAGVSAELRIAVAREAAHFLSPALLSLNDVGKVGVKSVDTDNHVLFHPIELVRTEANGVWVSGMPEQTQVITQGQGFVMAGETVMPVVETEG